jgi:hypothetical protein
MLTSSAETEGLETRYNDILFLRRKQTTEMLCGTQCARFLYHCSSRRQAQLRRLILKDEDIVDHSEGEGETGLVESAEESLKHPLNPYDIISAFRKAHPKAAVKQYHPHVNQSEWYTLFVGRLCAKASFRRPVDPVLCGGRSGTIFQTPLSHVERGGIFNKDIGHDTNFTVYSQEEVFDEQKFRRQVHEHDYLHTVVLPHVPGGVDAWVAEMKK